MNTNTKISCKQLIRNLSYKERKDKIPNEYNGLVEEALLIID